MGAQDLEKTKEVVETVRDYKPNIILSWIEGILKIIKEYGYLRCFIGVLFICLCSWIFYLSQNPNVIIDKIVEIQNKTHNDAFVYRIENESNARLVLKDALIELDADKVFIIEFHNGVANPSGLPFAYADATIEVTKAGIPFLESDFHDLSISRFHFISYVYKEGFWCGDVNEIRSIDKRFALRQEENDIKYLNMSVIYDSKGGIIGFLGAAYLSEREKVNKDKETRILNKFSVMVAPYLDAGYVNKKKH